MPNDLLKTLERDGIVVIGGLVSSEQLEAMQTAFSARLLRLRFSDVDGYEKTELYRHMVQDVLTLDQGFVDLALHPTVIGVLHQYLGDSFRLTEAKGWKSLATRRSFHDWHGDAWYDQEAIQGVPKEVKLALYLTDVSTGEFQYVRGSHRKKHPRNVFASEVERLDSSRIFSVTGRAGTAILFDTSGIHRQGEPILECRHAVFYNYHDPNVPLQAEDVAYYRYHPLILNAAFLGDLSEENQRILGFGDKSHYIHAFERNIRFVYLHNFFQICWDARLYLDDFWGRVRARLRRR